MSATDLFREGQQNKGFRLFAVSQRDYSDAAQWLVIYRSAGRAAQNLHYRGFMKRPDPRKVLCIKRINKNSKVCANGNLPPLENSGFQSTYLQSLALMVSILALTSVKDDIHRITNVQLERKKEYCYVFRTVYKSHTKTAPTNMMILWVQSPKAIK